MKGHPLTGCIEAEYLASVQVPGLMPPPRVGGSTLAEVLGNVKSGELSPMGTATRMAEGTNWRPDSGTARRT